MQLVTVLYVNLENFKINKEKLNAFVVLEAHIARLQVGLMMYLGMEIIVMV